MRHALGPTLLALALAGSAHGQAVEFNRDIRPLLSEYCFACHGPDPAKRKAGLRLDTPAGGKTVLVAGKPDQSELYQRLIDKDPKRRMPSASTGKVLSPKQIALFRGWIEQGAAYQGHWSLITPKRPTL